MWKPLIGACLTCILALPVTAEPCSSSAGFFPNTDDTPTPDLIFLDDGMSAEDTFTVEIVYGGPSTSSDIYGFSFELMIDDMSVVEFVSASPGPALDPSGCSDIIALGSVNGDRLIVGVSKLGDCPGNRILPLRATVVNLQFRFLQTGVTTIGMVGRVKVLDSKGREISGVAFDGVRGVAVLSEDTDLDGLADCEDNCATVHNIHQSDSDVDTSGDACDNCLLAFNPTQTNSDGDGEGDWCDLDDSIIFMSFGDENFVDWQLEQGFTTWNVYRGDLDVLRNGGSYSQPIDPAGLAARTCGLATPFLQDAPVLQPGEAAFYLVTGSNADSESSLGPDSTGTARPNTNPCPTGSGCEEVEVCGDTTDNDCDGFVDCLDSDCAGDPSCSGVEILRADFDGGADGFIYEDDTFRGTSTPAQAAGTHLSFGGFSGGGLEVMIGQNNALPAVGISGGWRTTFNVTGPGNTVLSFRYKLLQASGYEPGEISQVLASVDGTLFGIPPNDYVDQLEGDGNGGSRPTTDWQLAQIDLGVLSIGTHTLTLGGYNNQKNFFNEWSIVVIDDVELRQ